MGVSIVPALRALKPAALMIAVGLAGVLIGFWADAAFFPGTSPGQPIDFSHKIHAGDNAIPCMYCHVAGAAIDCRRRSQRQQVRELSQHRGEGPAADPQGHGLLGESAADPLDQGSRPAGLRLLPAQASRAGRCRVPDLSRAGRNDAAGEARRAHEDGLVPQLPQGSRSRERARLLDLSQVSEGSAMAKLDRRDFLKLVGAGGVGVGAGFLLAESIKHPLRASDSLSRCRRRSSARESPPGTTACAPCARPAAGSRCALARGVRR